MTVVTMSWPLSRPEIRRDWERADHIYIRGFTRMKLLKFPSPSSPFGSIISYIHSPSTRYLYWYFPGSSSSLIYQLLPRLSILKLRSQPENDAISSTWLLAPCRHLNPTRPSSSTNNSLGTGSGTPLFFFFGGTGRFSLLSVTSRSVSSVTSAELSSLVSDNSVGTCSSILWTSSVLSSSSSSSSSSSLSSSSASSSSTSSSSSFTAAASSLVCSSSMHLATPASSAMSSGSGIISSGCSSSSTGSASLEQFSSSFSKGLVSLASSSSSSSTGSVSLESSSS
mmetsp:Transcript_10113/g.14604  ORF Transcript_10113/g.14604 Transcript_10113/m.14604 type:complete len:282 (+) Transcript_10113:699-1544(+)